MTPEIARGILTRSRREVPRTECVSYTADELAAFERHLARLRAKNFVYRPVQAR